ERYGSCLARLRSPRLLDGYLPVLETSYVDGYGVRYEQESFAARIPQTAALVSFVRLRVLGRSADVHFTASASGYLRRGNPAGRTIYVAWLNSRAPSEPFKVDEAAYEAALQTVREY